MFKKILMLFAVLGTIIAVTTGCSLFKEPEETEFERKSLEIYHLAQEAGFTGTYEEWLESIKGEKGDKGDTGEQGPIGPKGETGDDGTPGKGIADVKVYYKTINEEKKICFEFIMTDGTKIYQYLDPITEEPVGPVTPTIEEYNVEDYYHGYYTSITSWTNGEDLINQLHTLISGNGYTAIKYAQNWEICQHADLSITDTTKVDVVYSDVDLGVDYTYNTSSEPKRSDGWQREHAFCASLMCGSTTGNATKFLGRATDWHNLFAAGAGNSSRGNKNFGVANKSDSKYTDRTINNGFDGYSYDSKNFEPGDKDKGRLSRAIYYMTVMYNQDVTDTSNNVNMKALRVVDEYVDYVAGNDCAFAIGNGQTLFQWAHNDVDLLEYQHNEAVYSYKFNDKTAQGNRNPFVDYPELIDYCFGDKKNQAGELKYITPSVVNLDLTRLQNR